MPRSWVKVNSMLSRSEKSVLAVFRTFLVQSGEMICFTAPQLQKYGPTLVGLTKKNLVVREQCAGGYSLTREGFAAMKEGGRGRPLRLSP
jgi:hypothetical protein